MGWPCGDDEEGEADGEVFPGLTRCQEISFVNNTPGKDWMISFCHCRCWSGKVSMRKAEILS